MRRTGKYAYVDGIPCTGGWAFSRATTASRYQASCVPGASAASEGNLDETGNVSGMGYLPPMPSEDPFEFIGVASAKAGEVINWEGDVIFTDVTLNIPVAAGTPINWTANFGVNGHLTKTTTPALTDPTRERAPSAKWGKITVEDVPDSNTFTEVERPQNISIVFRRPASTSVTDGETDRDPGNLEVDLNFDVHNDDFQSLLDLNETKRVRVYVTDTLFYLFDAIIWTGHGNYRVDRSQNPPPIIGYSVTGMWTALRDQDPPALGQILLPDGSQLYGPGST